MVGLAGALAAAYNMGMSSQWKQTMTVKPGGRVEIVLPELNGGETVEVVVRRQANTVAGTTRPGFGRASGRITIRDDFDDPIEDFADYM